MTRGTRWPAKRLEQFGTTSQLQQHPGSIVDEQLDETSSDALNEMDAEVDSENSSAPGETGGQSQVCESSVARPLGSEAATPAAAADAAPGEGARRRGQTAFAGCSARPSARLPRPTARPKPLRLRASVLVATAG